MSDNNPTNETELTLNRVIQLKYTSIKIRGHYRFSTQYRSLNHQPEVSISMPNGDSEVYAHLNLDQVWELKHYLGHLEDILSQATKEEVA